MARSMMVMAENQEAAEQKARDESPDIRVLRSKEIDLSGLPPLRSGPLERHWTIVFELRDAEKEAALPQEENPEERCERFWRQFYLKMATDPELLNSGVHESANCPSCHSRVMVELPPARDRPDPEYARCPECGTHLNRAKGDRPWSAVIRRGPSQCVFCDNQANSKEHVIPKWISKQLGVKSFLTPLGSSPGSRNNRQPISFASYRKRIFCASCNEHFKHVEDRAIPLLVPMARGRTLSLGPESQDVLALWAAKTGIALISAMAETADIVPEEHRKSVRLDGSPHPNMWVGIFYWNGGPVAAADQTSYPTSAESIETRTVYRALLAFRNFGFCVAGVDDLPGDGRAIGGEPGPVLQIHPPLKRSIIWPSAEAFEIDVLRLTSFLPLQGMRSNP